MERQARKIAGWARQRLREDPGHQHRGPRPASTWCGALSATGVQAQRHRADDPRPGRRDRRRARRRQRPRSSRCSPAASPTPGASPCRSWCEALDTLRPLPDVELIWASPREVLNIVQADRDRLPHHHRHPRPAQEARAARQGPRRVLARHRADVPSRRRRRRVHAVTEPAGRVSPGRGGRLGRALGADSDTAARNPAQAFRRRLVLGRLRAVGPIRRYLDIGSGQGDLAVDVAAEWPEAEIVGIELSATGVAHRSRASCPPAGSSRSTCCPATVPPTTWPTGPPMPRARRCWSTSTSRRRS